MASAVGAGADSKATAAAAPVVGGPWYRVVLSGVKPLAVWTAVAPADANASAVAIECRAVVDPTAVAGATHATQAWSYDAKTQRLQCAAYPALSVATTQTLAGATVVQLTEGKKKGAAAAADDTRQWSRLVVQLTGAGSIVKFVSVADAEMALDAAPADAAAPPKAQGLSLRKQKRKDRTQEFVLTPIVGAPVGAAVAPAAVSDAPKPAAPATAVATASAAAATGAGAGAAVSLVCPYYARAKAAAARAGPAAEGELQALLLPDALVAAPGSHKTVQQVQRGWGDAHHAWQSCAGPLVDGVEWGHHMQAPELLAVHLRMADFAHAKLQAQVDGLQELVLALAGGAAPPRK